MGVDERFKGGLKNLTSQDEPERQDSFPTKQGPSTPKPSSNVHYVPWEIGREIREQRNGHKYSDANRQNIGYVYSSGGGHYGYGLR